MLPLMKRSSKKTLGSNMEMRFAVNPPILWRLIRNTPFEQHQEFNMDRMLTFPMEWVVFRMDVVEILQKTHQCI